MASYPQLPNHLVRELMNTIRFREKGDAMVRMALSGKEPFSVFKYVVENHVYAFVEFGRVFLQSWRGRIEIGLKFRTEGSEHLANRFVRKLCALGTLTKPLPFEKILELTISYGFDKSFPLILHSFIDLEMLQLGLNLKEFDDFLNEINNGNISLTKLRKLDISLKFDSLLKLLSTTPLFPLPEVVTFSFEINGSVPNLVSLKTFPKVKHLVFKLRQQVQMTSAILHHISTVANCFTGLETAKIKLYYSRFVDKNAFAEVVEFHEWLRNTNFSFPIEVDYQECARLDYPESPKIIYEQLKSIGYKEESVGFKKHWNGDAFFVLKKEFGNVKLNHYITHIEDYLPF